MKPRENWGSHLGFLMATAGSAIGLGSLWKFPYVTGENGGGLFVIAYLVFTLIIGIPIFIAELVIGRGAKRAPVGAYRTLTNKPAWRLLGWSSVVSTLLILSYYIVVAGWALNYTLMSLLDFSANKAPDQIIGTFEVLYRSTDLNLLLSFLFLCLTTAIVYRGIRGGIEFWSKILTPALLVILLLLFLYSTTLSGFSEAFAFIFKPDASKLKPSSLLQALGLACFTLSVGMGIILTYGSYMRENEDIPKTAFTIASINVLVSLMAAMMIFPIIFTFGFSPQEGPGLLFKTMPLVFSKLPGTLLLSTIFFLLVLFAALTSAISVLEVLVATATENFKMSRKKAVLIISAVIFIIGVPSALAGSNTLFKNWTPLYGKNFFDTVDFFSFSWLLPINALFTAIFAGWVLDASLKKKVFAEGSTLTTLFYPWLFLMRWVVPAGVILIMLHQGGILDIDAIFSKLRS